MEGGVNGAVDGVEVTGAEEIRYRTLLEEERVKAATTRKELEEYKAKVSQFKDIDPEKYRQYEARIQQIEEQKLIDSNDVDKLIDLRVQRMKQDHDGRTKALEEANARILAEKVSLSNKLSELLIDSQINQMVNRIGKPAPGAYVDILHRAKTTFKLVDNVPTPMTADGTVIYSKNGKEPMSFDEFGIFLQETAPHLWESVSGGGGSTGSASGRTGSGGVDYISGNDPVMFGKNLEAIASGKIKVR